MKEVVQQIISRISFTIFGQELKIKVSYDNIHDNGRIYIQVVYDAPCTKTNTIETWKGRKWYLSEFMTTDEIVKTCYVAIESCVKHEVMESFKVDGKILFNPHVNFEILLAVSDNEVFRK